ncbi:MAG: hypothetical protein H7281_01945 [Bacteriovorax sp.]|nr:hypothetical protein [Bacteriovorax sp.]
MKILLFLIVVFPLNANAHCPFSFKPEKVCFMLDQNILYIWDQKFEHNGPYKDLVASEISSIKNKDKVLFYSKIARGVYKIVNETPLALVEIEIKGKNTKNVLKVKSENK